MYLTVIHPTVKNAPFHRGGGYDHGGMYQIMSAARVLKVCSLCYSVVPTIWGVPPLTTQNWCIYNLDNCKHDCIHDIENMREAPTTVSAAQVLDGLSAQVHHDDRDQPHEA